MHRCACKCVYMQVCLPIGLFARLYALTSACGVSCGILVGVRNLQKHAVFRVCVVFLECGAMKFQFLLPAHVRGNAGGMCGTFELVMHSSNIIRFT